MAFIEPKKICTVHSEKRECGCLIYTKITIEYKAPYFICTTYLVSSHEVDHSYSVLLLIFHIIHRVSIDRKCPCIKKLKGEDNFPWYFDNDDVIYL